MEKVQLPIWRTLRSAMFIITERWRSFLYALILPALLSVLLNIMYWFGQAVAMEEFKSDAANSSLAVLYIIASPFLSILCDGILSTLIAVSCHRITIFDGTVLPGKWGIYWSRRETRFFGWLVLFGIPVILTSVAYFQALPFGIQILNIETPASSMVRWGWMTLHSLLLIGVTIVVTAPFGLALPLTAIDKKASLQVAWRLVYGNIFRVAAVLAIPMLLIWGASTATYYLLDGAGGKGVLALIQLGFILLGAFEIIVLSVSYQQLVSAKNRG